MVFTYVLSVKKYRVRYTLFRYEDRLRNEDLAVQAAFEKRKESKKLSQASAKQIKPKPNLPPTQEESYDFFTKVDWGPEVSKIHLINSFTGSPGCNRQHHGQTIYPTEKFTSMNLFKILWIVTWT